MEIARKDYHKLPFSKLFCDFIDEKDSISSFYSHGHSYKQLREAVQSHSMLGDRIKAAGIIKNFNREFSLDEKAQDNLDALSDDQTVTITTGQQVSLFGGPLYTVFKTLTVILLAKKLSDDTGRRVVPVFWLADEDHDYEEIARVLLPEKQTVRKFILPSEEKAHHAAGSIEIGSDFEAFRNEIFNALPDTDFHGELGRLLNECYAPGQSFRNAFGELIARLFSRYGLILAGSNFRDAKSFTADKIKTAITNAGLIRTKLNEQSSRIAKTYHQQAQVLDSLLFWHDDKLGRVRLVRENDTWTRDPGVVLSEKELLELVEKDPASFSPNVFLRPIIQDALLPNAAYVGGPAEIAYYGQMKPVYEIFEQKMPFIAGRLSATLVEPTVNRSLADLPYDIPDFAKRIEDLEQHYLRTHGDPDLDKHFETWKNEVNKLTGSMTNKIGIQDPGLKKHSQAITKEHIKAIDKLHKKMVHAIRQKEEVQINRIKKVKFALFPCDHLQEREISFIYFMNKYGLDIWDRMYDVLESGDTRLFNEHLVINL